MSTVVDKYKVTLPDLADSAAIEGFLSDLEMNRESWGVKKLITLVQKQLMHAQLAAKFHERALKTAAYVNGERSERAGRPRKHGISKLERNRMEKFYSSLNTPSLRMHADMYGLDYDSYDSVEEIIQALITKTIEHSNNN